MKILLTGRGTSGSWRIRGEQLGHAIGADVRPRAIDVAPYDVAIVVKRPPADLLSRLHKARVPIVYDIVDAWPQPAGNEWDEKRCLAWLQEMVSLIKPAGIVAATQAMAKDCERFGVPVLALPHHARPGLRLNPIRPISVVGYEGGENYIVRWRESIESECSRRGWKFITKPAELADVDIVLALRDSQGYAPRHWKSNVKLANAQGSGTPVICNREAGYLETDTTESALWADNMDEMRQAFDALTPNYERQQVSKGLKAAAPSIDALAATYKQWLLSKF